MDCRVAIARPKRMVQRPASDADSKIGCVIDGQRTGPQVVQDESGLDGSDRGEDGREEDKSKEPCPRPAAIRDRS